MKKFIAIFLITALIFSFAGCGDKQTASQSSEKSVHTEVGVEISTEAFPENTVLKVETVKPETQKYQTAKTALPKAIKLDAYEITAESEGVKVQPDGTVLVTFPVPESYDSTKHDIEVYFVADDGTTEKITASTTANGVVAELKHFSTYVVILVEKDSVVSSDTASTSSETSTSTSTSTSSNSSSSVPVSSTPTPSSSNPKPSSTTSSTTSSEKISVPTLSKKTVEDMLSKFLYTSVAAYDATDNPYGDLYNGNLKNLNNLTAESFIFYYCYDELQKYADTSAEFPTVVVPKSFLDTLAKRYLGYTYDFTKSYTFDDFVVAITYDSKNKTVTFTEGGGGFGGPDGFKIMSYTQKDDTLTLNLKYHTLTEETPSGKEGTDWVDATSYGYEGCYYTLRDPSTLTFKYVDGYWRIISYKAN